MASDGRIELFKFTQKTCQDIGIYPPDANRNASPLNLKNVLVLFCLGQFFISSAANFSFDASSMIEYGMAFFTCLSTSLSIITYLIIIWRLKIILNYIETCKRFIEKSKYTSSEVGAEWTKYLDFCTF